MLEIVVLAAGKGTRMRSKLPKVLHTLAGKSFLQHVINTSRKLDSQKNIIVIGHGAETIRERIVGEDLAFVTQAEQLGTGHAVSQALPEIDEDAQVLILYGDVPLIKSATLKRLTALVSDASMGLLTVSLRDPSGYGRIVRGQEGEVIAIVEQKDANDKELQINEVNTGVMAVRGRHLMQWLPRLSNDNAQDEFYLTDIIAMASADGIAVLTSHPDDEIEVIGVNDRIQQANLERAYQAQFATRLMEQGLSFADPARFDCRGELDHGSDCFIDVNCVFEGKVELGANVRIGPNCFIKDAKIAENSVIHANSVVEDAQVGKGCSVGPYARLRPGSRLSNFARIGNFVETKNAHIGLGSKVNHLSYVGDAEVGDNVNIGAGTITCNYDGANKSLTQIEDGAFIGSNSALVAPVKVARNSTVAAGSTVTRDSEPDQLIVARSKQRNIEGWQRPKKKEKK